jgi:replicative DNA helicase
MKCNLGMVIVDYLQLVPSSKTFDNRAQEVASMSRAFKLGSLALNVPFVILSQLNDDGKTKEDRAISALSPAARSRPRWPRTGWRPRGTKTPTTA